MRVVKFLGHVMHKEVMESLVLTGDTDVKKNREKEGRIVTYGA